MIWFGDITMGPVSQIYEEGQYDETPYCANCNLEVGPGGRVDAKSLNKMITIVVIIA